MTSTRFSPGARAAVAALAVGAVTVALAGCATGTDTTNTAANSDADAVYRIPITDPGSEIDPLTVADYNAQLISGLVTEPLVSLDADGALNPRLATAWEASEDGLTWTVTLREGALFNDGSPVTSADVVATFEAITGEDSLSAGRSAFEGILDSVAADGDGTVVFTLARAFSDFPLLLTGTNTGILPADYEPGTWLDNPVGAGQFLLEDYTVGEGATYVKNPDYWDADDILVDGVELKIYDDSQASLLAFQAGEIDRIALTSDVAAAVDESQYQVISSGYNKFDGIFLNVEAAPFDDPAVREALAWAIDRQGLIDNVYEGNADIANDVTFFPDYELQPAGLEQREQDLDKVAELLDGRTVSFTITTDNQLYGEVLQQQLNAVPGFEVDLDVLTGEQYYADGDATPWLNAPLTITNWAKRAPSQYISLIYTADAAWNASHYANPEIEQLGQSFDATTDEAERQGLADDIAAIQWSDLPVIIPTFAKGSVLQSTRIEGEFAGDLDFDTGYSFAGVSISE
ncbi:ABC transporter substrate-binding protein [Microbacterium terricola]|uniref:Peptide ABC transporter substrate-binding protein n=1 Tax=Microbacterium terricola TaxID=344163 RepID=A0ABM8E257_9MICO|nr:ABC transporter substrate-binding protein [Microbacterium terricola]UYK40467.1 ABC transporter substrate-binding protein [Microbacterium terricola]BDV31811.1 peptide ABC transporter substrate-binding protein [Microbacterium terricola]